MMGKSCYMGMGARHSVTPGVGVWMGPSRGVAPGVGVAPTAWG